MAFNNWAYIYLGMGEEDPAVDRAVIERGGLRTTIVAVPEKSAVVQAAIELVDGGALSPSSFAVPSGRYGQRA